MPCLQKFTTNTRDGYPVIVGCGSCYSCQKSKVRSYICRNLLEYQTTATQSFWTLTYENLPTSEKRMGMDLRKFFSALRNSEKRAANPFPIRFFGCLEYGGSFGRPHFHLLIYNLVKNYRRPAPYRSGLPRPRIHLGQWPHGHVDIAELNEKTIRYVCKYLTKSTSSNPDSTPGKLFRTVRPGIGAQGLWDIGAKLASKQWLKEIPTSILVDGFQYAVDPWMKEQITKGYRSAGGRLPPEHPLSRWKRKRVESYLLTPLDHQLTRFIRNEQSEKNLLEIKRKQKERFEVEVSLRTIERVNARPNDQVSEEKDRPQTTLGDSEAEC